MLSILYITIVNYYQYYYYYYIIIIIIIMIIIIITIIIIIAIIIPEPWAETLAAHAKKSHCWSRGLEPKLCHR